MSRTVRIVLYILSLLTVAGLIAAFVVAGGRQQSQETMQQSTATEEGATAEGATAEGVVAEVVTNTDSDPTQEETMETQESNAEDTEETEAAQQTKDGVTTILFTGDVLFANAFKAGYDTKGIEGVISEELLQELRDADILMVNNEFPFSDQGAAMEDKQFTFRCSPSYVSALNEMGVDVVSLANNHTLDYGKEALTDTFQALDGAGICYGGAGGTVERAEEVQTIEIDGKTYGFLAVSRVVPTADWKVENSTPGIFTCYSDTRLVELVQEAKEYCDYLAVYPHWGIEYEAYPEAYQTQIAERCIEAGADVIVGSHTHCLQGVSYIDGKPVFYSLGNFIFGQTIDRSAILKVTIDASGNVSYQYIPVYAAGGVTYMATGERAAQTYQYLDSISPEATVGADGVVVE